MIDQVSKSTSQADSKRSSYRQIMKATSIFGGVQVFQIVITIIRSKFVAVLLGPAGMGIASLLDATIGMIAAITNFGLSTSAVKDISAAHSTGSKDHIVHVSSVFRRLVWFTGMLGTLITVGLAPWLSELTFGNRDFTWAFIWLSGTLLLRQLSDGQSVLLRGTRQIRMMAKAGMFGSLLGLIVTVPLYYFYGIRGIVPGMILTAFTSFFLNWYFVQKLRLDIVPVEFHQVLSEGRSMLKMGFLISLNGLITLGIAYILRIFIGRIGNIDQVGLYSAGFAIINTYVGLVFTAMSTDYYPRLSAVAHSNEKSREVINQQAEIALLILAPIIMIFLVFINWVVIILYSTKFLPINDMILYAALGMFFKAASWAIAFIFLAKGASKLFFWNELITNSYTLTFNLLGFFYWGLAGLGVSFFVSYVLYLIQVYSVAKAKYDIKFNGSFLKMFAIQVILAVFCLVTVKMIGPPYKYIVGLFIITVSIIHALNELEKRLNILTLIKNFVAKSKK